MSETGRLANQFEILVARILRSNQFEIEKTSQEWDIGFDLLGSYNNETWAVEVKYYRTSRPQVPLLEIAANRLAKRILKETNKQINGVVVLACSLGPDLRSALERKFGLRFIDRADLFKLAANAPELFDELSTFLEEGIRSDDLAGRDLQEILANQAASNRVKLIARPEDTTGTTLENALQALHRGRGSWAAYENLCDKILQYLFRDDLHGWHKQKRTDDGLNRFDYVCRIKPRRDFWKFVIEHLDSRYVLFEFKNYTGLIKQGQILTTEKYLLEKGLRRAAIIFSREGADKSAIAMTQGAMRETGKLMLVLDDEKVCRMLEMKQNGEDPTDLLFEVADEFLLSLPR